MNLELLTFEVQNTLSCALLLGLVPTYECLYSLHSLWSCKSFPFNNGEFAFCSC